jgi:hypothetical protein
MDFHTMDFCAKGPAHLFRGAGKVDDHPARVDRIDFQAVRPEPVSYPFQILFGYAKSVAKFIRANPFVKVGGIRVVERVNELLNRFLLLGGAAQLQQQVMHGVVIFHFAAVVFFLAGLRMSVALQGNQLAFIDVLGNPGTRVPSHVNGLRICELDREHQGQRN